MARPDAPVLLPRLALDTAAWDACVEAAGHVPYARSWYLDAASERRWDAVVWPSAEGGYAAVCPLPWRRRWGLTVGWTPFFVQQLGVFAASGEAPPLAEALALVPRARVRVRLQVRGTPPAPAGWRATARPNRVLPLDRPYADIAAGYGSNLRRNLRRAGAAGLSVADGPSPEAFTALFRAHQGPRVPELGPADYARMARLMAEGLERGEFRLYRVPDPARPDDTLAAAAFWDGPRGPVYAFGSSTPAARETGAMALLFDAEIRRVCGVTTDAPRPRENGHALRAKTPQMLDFEGSTRPGLARFYAGFGGHEENYTVLKRGFFGLF
jgi:hypothetical protein